MKKFFGALLALVVLFAANLSHAAKFQPLADIDAYNLFLNIGYEVDCSHWERRSGKQLYYAIIPEEPLVIAKDMANIEVYADMRKSRVIAVDLYLQSDADQSAMTAIVAKVLKALDADAFTTNQVAIEKSVGDLLNSNQPADEVIVAFDANRNFALSKETRRGKVLVVSIRPADELKKV